MHTPGKHATDTCHVPRRTRSVADEPPDDANACEQQHQDTERAVPHEHRTAGLIRLDVSHFTGEQKNYNQTNSYPVERLTDGIVSRRVV